jgi:hypothetical protein
MATTSYPFNPLITLRLIDSLSMTSASSCLDENLLLSSGWRGSYCRSALFRPTDMDAFTTLSWLLLFLSTDEVITSFECTDFSGGYGSSESSVFAFSNA